MSFMIHLKKLIISILLTINCNCTAVVFKTFNSTLYYIRSWSNSLLCCILKFAAVFIKKELRLWAGFISFLIAKLFSSRIHFNFSYYWREVALSCNVYHIVTTYMRKKKSRKVLLQLLACVINLLSIKKDCRLWENFFSC